VGARVDRGLGIARRSDRGSFNHEYHRPLRGASAVYDALRNNETMLLCEFYTSVLEVNDETTVKNKKELVVIIVFVPVVLACMTPRRITESFT
jgi:hypothetical protein